MRWNRLLRIGLPAAVVVAASSCGDTAGVGSGASSCFEGGVEFRIVNPLQILELAVEVDWEGVEGGCEFSKVITKQSDDTIEDFLVDAHAGDVFTISAVTPDLPRVTRACTAGPSVEVNEALVVRVEADLIVGLMIICDDAGNWQVTGPPPSP